MIKEDSYGKKMTHAFPTSLKLFFTLFMLLNWNAGQACAQKAPTDLQAFLERKIGLSKKDISKIDSDVMVKQVAMNEKSREIAVFAIVRMSVPQDVFVSQFRQIDRFMENDKLHQISILSTPPRNEDFSTLQLPESDFEEMARCRIGSCKVKLPAEALHRLQEIDWSAQHADDNAMELFRKGIANYVRAYIENGNSTLMVYADKESPITLTEGFESLISQEPSLYRSHPELISYLKDFSRPPPQGVEDFFFWSLEDFGQRPTFTITQATIYERRQEKNPTIMIALKQLYASHYFQARLQLIDLVTASTTREGPALYLLYLDRLRFDAGINKINQIVISKSLQSHVKSWLQLLRKNLQELKVN
jgi:hypothetical protein